MTDQPKTFRSASRALLEMGFIIFLFYSNLLMGQYNLGHTFADRPILTAVRAIVTVDNFIIAVLAAVIGHVAFDWMRRRL
jgi:hypothetical protein